MLFSFLFCCPDTVRVGQVGHMPSLFQTGGSDFSPLNRLLGFQTGSSDGDLVCFTVRISDDRFPENDEYFMVQMELAETRLPQSIFWMTKVSIHFLIPCCLPSWDVDTCCMRCVCEDTCCMRSVCEDTGCMRCEYICMDTCCVEC